MLQPKRTKYRKQMKGKNRGLALRGSTVAFGEYGLKATGRGRILMRARAVIESAKCSIGACAGAGQHLAFRFNQA